MACQGDAVQGGKVGVGCICARADSDCAVVNSQPRPNVPGSEARRRFGVCGYREVSTAFYGLRDLVRRRKRLRILTIDRWKDRCRSYWQLPFRAWYLYMIDQKLLRRVRAMLIASFRRKLLRRLVWQMVHAWRELTKYKVVETRSRAQLLELLETPSAYYDGFVEGAYLRVDEGEHNCNRGKIVRPDFIQGITTHWQSHAFVKNGLRLG